MLSLFSQFPSSHVRSNVFASVADALRCASEESRNDPVKAFAAVSQTHGKWALWYASEESRGNKALVLAAVAHDGWALEYASEELKGDKKVVLAAVAREGHALQFASDALRGDKEVVLAAVAKNGNVLRFASEELKNDREVVLAAVRKTGQALQYASEELRHNDELRRNIESGCLLRATSPPSPPPLDVDTSPPSPPPPDHVDTVVPTEGDICGVCCREYTLLSVWRTLGCGHKFHMDCVDPWLIWSEGVCPVCRRQTHQMLW